MDLSEVAALAKTTAVYVREAIAAEVVPLIARVAELEARPIEKGDTGPQGEDGPEGPQGPKGDPGELGATMLPPELVAEVARAARLLHELPPVAVRSEGAPRVTRIERDETGAFVPIYDEPQS